MFSFVKNKTAAVFASVVSMATLTNSALAQITLSLSPELSSAPDISALTTAALAFVGAFVSVALLIKGVKWLISAIV